MDIKFHLTKIHIFKLGINYIHTILNAKIMRIILSKIILKSKK